MLTAPSCPSLVEVISDLMKSSEILIARRLELNPPRLTGDPAVVAEQVGLASGNGFANFSVSRNGTLFYGRENPSARMRLGWRDREGKLLEAFGQPVESGFTFALSPDDNRVAYSAGARQTTDVWVLELARGVTNLIKFSTAGAARWSPNGKHLYYRNARGIHRKSADGSGEEELVWKGNAGEIPQCVSPDGRYLLFGNGDILALPLTGERKPEPYLQSKYAESGADFSPDGRWVAYASDESGRQEVYIQGFPDRRGKFLVSSAGGRGPQWRADGKELYWVGPGNTVMAASVELQASGVRVEGMKPLFRLPAPGAIPIFQPARDGRRFLVWEPEGGQQPDRPMVVIQNWAAGLAK